MVVGESKKPSSHALEVEKEGACEKQGGEEKGFPSLGRGQGLMSP